MIADVNVADGLLMSLSDLSSRSDKILRTVYPRLSPAVERMLHVLSELAEAINYVWAEQAALQPDPPHDPPSDDRDIPG